MSSKEAIFGLNIAGAICLAIAALFYLIATIGYSNKDDDVKNASWFTMDDLSQVELYIGLKKAVIEVDVDDFTTTLDIRYSSSDCNLDFCNACRDEGDAAFGLLVGATVFAAFAAAINLISLCAPAVGVQILALVAAILAGCISIIGFGIFIDGKCKKKLDDSLTGIDLDYGPAATLCLVGFLLNWIAVIFAFVCGILASIEERNNNNTATSNNPSDHKPSPQSSAPQTVVAHPEPADDKV